MKMDCFFYPKVNIEVSAAAEFAVADLEGDGHLVVRVQLLMEALARVRLELDVVRRADGEEAAESSIEECEDKHDCWLVSSTRHTMNGDIGGKNNCLVEDVAPLSLGRGRNCTGHIALRPL